MASALFSWTKDLNYSIMAKQGPKIRFNFYDIKTGTNVGINPYTSREPKALGMYRDYYRRSRYLSLNERKPVA